MEALKNGAVQTVSLTPAPIVLVLLWLPASIVEATDVFGGGIVEVAWGLEIIFLTGYTLGAPTRKVRQHSL